MRLKVILELLSNISPKPFTIPRYSDENPSMLLLKLKSAFTVLAITSSLSLSANSLANEQPLSFSAKQISGSVYMLSGQGGFTGGNIALSIGNDGVAMIDNGTANILTILRAKVAELTEKPIDYLINTHVHADHTGNNVEYGKSGARIISHENLRSNMAEKGIGDADAPSEALPVITFSDQMTLHINGDVAKIIHVKNAHTDGDAIIHFKEANVIHTGDVMFNKVFPYIDYSNGGGIDGAIIALKTVSELSNADTKIIPGHGDLASKADVDETVAMLEDAKSIIGKMVTNGKSDEEILAAKPLEKYKSYSWDFIDSDKMIQQVIAGVR